MHVYYGDGVGKTTRSIGLLIRAAGAGKKVFFMQFMKDEGSSEVSILKKIPGIEYQCTGTLGFIFERKPTRDEKELALNGLEKCMDASSGEFDIVIADEALNALGKGLIGEEGLMSLIDGRKKDVELVLTGRPCPESILKKSDYATEFKMVKHPHMKGKKARKGIDY